MATGLLTALGASLRLLRVLGHAVAGYWTIRTRFHALGPDQRARRVEQWARRTLAALRITLDVRGTLPATGPLLLVANHVSWLDIVVLHAARHCRFVSKAEISRWPIAGTLAGSAGTLYIERSSRRDALRVAHRMADALRAGDVLAVFPEGTTSDGTALLPFHSNLLQAAISAGAPVQPLALQFIDSATRAQTFAPRYVGDDRLAASLWRVLCAPPITAVLHCGAPQPAAGRQRREWAQALQHDVASMLLNT